MQIKVRAATLRDARVIAALSGELGYPMEVAAARARLRRILGRRDQRVFVAEGAGGELGGWLQAHASEVLAYGFRVEIAGLVVGTHVRRRGVGRRLVARAEEWAARLGASEVSVRSNAARVESHAFYPSLGYQVSKTQIVYRKPLAT